jgi:hypothetical protein
MGYICIIYGGIIRIGYMYVMSTHESTLESVYANAKNVYGDDVECTYCFVNNHEQSLKKFVEMMKENQYYSNIYHCSVSSAIARMQEVTMVNKVYVMSDDFQCFDHSTDDGWEADSECFIPLP